MASADIKAFGRTCLLACWPRTFLHPKYFCLACILLAAAFGMITSEDCYGHVA